MDEQKSAFVLEMMGKMIQAESGIRGRDPGPWRVVAEYLAQLERRVVAIEGREGGPNVRANRPDTAAQE